MPILGIIDSAKTNWLSTTSYDSIATVTPNTTATTVEFNSIPATYKHLQIRALVFTSAYSTLRFNGDTTTTNYRSHYLGGQGSITFAGSDANQAYFANGGSANGYAAVVDILDYTNTNKYKTQRTAAGWDNNGSGEVYLTSSLWMSTSAITSIKITSASGNFTTGSHFALYGIKGA